jgi:Family of unknown function (DUF6159)
MTDSPYAYQPPQPAAPGPATGKQLLQASWGLLRQDQELLWLPVISSVFGLIAAAILFVPGFALGWAVAGSSVGVYVGGALAAFAASIVAIYFQAALVVGANERADGGNPTLRGVLAQAWTLRVRILKWAAVTTTVGVAIRALEQRLGVLGSILGFLGGIAWAIASFLVVPILVVEDIGPIAAVKRSAQLLRDTWGTSLRTTLRFGLVQLALIVPVILVFIVGAVALASGSTVGVILGVLLIVVGVVALIALGMIFSAVSSYARALIYRYATGRPIPGVDPRLFTGVFRQKRIRRRGRFA